MKRVEAGRRVIVDKRIPAGMAQAPERDHAGLTMSGFPEGELTRLLRAAESGDAAASGRAFELVYQELRRLAGAQMSRTPPGQTLEPTALVHEAFLRLMGRDDPRRSTDRRHFFAAAAQAMRDIVIESARRKGRLKRGGGWRRLDVDEVEAAGRVAEASGGDLIALDEAISELARAEPRCAEVVRLRYWTGLKMDEIAEVLALSVPTVERDWRFARTYLFARLTEGS
ncbi:MAG: extracytoplasmic sigma factor ECF [Planctomycetota bacterium]|nr:MAG: extracytoplasmic sigma factor ECF [Planctomycetota bacterium]